MKKTAPLLALSVLSAVLLTGTRARAMLSDTTLVDATTGQYHHWSTVYTNTVPLRWDCIPEATHAKLDIVGMNGTFTTNFAADVSTCLWQAFTPAATSEEDVYDLTLTLYGDGETVIETLTARLAVVAGAVGGATINAVAESAAWSKVKKMLYSLTMRHGTLRRQTPCRRHWRLRKSAAYRRPTCSQMRPDISVGRFSTPGGVTARLICRSPSRTWQNLWL